MVLLTLVDLSANVILWGLGHVYHAGYWMIYGTPKSETDLLLEKQNESLQQLRQEIQDIKRKLEESVPEKR